MNNDNILITTQIKTKILKSLKNQTLLFNYDFIFNSTQP